MGYKGIHKKGELSLSKLLKSVKEKPDFHRAGALATFIGVVRGKAQDGENVEKLELEAYDEEANRILGGICEELKMREGVVDVQIHHFVGEFDIGEDLVYVVIAGTHRENVFGILREAVERYKHETPVFKKEHVVDKAGINRKSYWVSEREAQKNAGKSK
jgi:molybdopterin synthase catalytic subunit